jgi:hypothetical protein
MANNRTPRDLETREKNPTRYVYKPASTLPDPTPDPDYDFFWVAISIAGQDNATNVSQKRRDGWEPVKAVDHPELQVAGNKDGNVEIGGLLLCKAPKEMVEGRREYFAQKARNQMESVDNSFMKNNDARMPLFSDRKTTVSKGGGFGNGSK